MMLKSEVGCGSIPGLKAYLFFGKDLVHESELLPVSATHIRCCSYMQQDVLQLCVCGVAVAGAYVWYSSAHWLTVCARH